MHKQNTFPHTNVFAKEYVLGKYILCILSAIYIHMHSSRIFQEKVFNRLADDKNRKPEPPKGNNKVTCSYYSAVEVCRSHLWAQEAALHWASNVCDCRTAGVEEGQEGFRVVKHVQIEKCQTRGALECVQHEQRLPRIGILVESHWTKRDSSWLAVDGENEILPVPHCDISFSRQAQWRQVISKILDYF